MPSNLQEKTLPDNVILAITDVANSKSAEAKTVLYESALTLINDLEDLMQKIEAYAQLLGALPKNSPLASECQAKLIEAEVESVVETPLANLVDKVTTTHNALDRSKETEKEKKQIQELLASNVKKALRSKPGQADRMHDDTKALKAHKELLTELGGINDAIKKALQGHLERTNTFIEYGEAEAEKQLQAKPVSKSNDGNTSDDSDDSNDSGIGLRIAEAKEARAVVAMGDFSNFARLADTSLMGIIETISKLRMHLISCPDLSGDIIGCVNTAISSARAAIMKKMPKETIEAQKVRELFEEMTLLQKTVSAALAKYNKIIKKSDHQDKSNISVEEALLDKFDISVEEALLDTKEAINQQIATLEKRMIDTSKAEALQKERVEKKVKAEKRQEQELQELAKLDGLLDAAEAVATAELAAAPVLAAELVAQAITRATKELELETIKLIGTGDSIEIDEMEYLTRIADQNPELIPKIEASLRAVIPRMLEPRANQTLGEQLKYVYQIINYAPNKLKAKLTIHAASAYEVLITELGLRAVDRSRMIALKKLIAEAKTLTETKDLKTVKSILDVRDRIVDAADSSPGIQQLLDRLIERANKIMDDSTTPTYQKPPTAVREANDHIPSRVAKAAITRALSEHSAKYLLENGVDDAGGLLRAEAELASHNTDPALIRDMAYASSEHLHAWLSRSRKNQAIQNVAAVTMDRIAHKAKIELHQQADHAIAQFINQLKDESITLPSIVSNISTLLGPFFKSCPELASKLNRAINFTVTRFCGDKSPSIGDIQSALDKLQEVKLAYRANAEEILTEAEAKALIAEAEEAEVAEVAAEIAADSNTGVSPEGSINHDTVPAAARAAAVKQNTSIQMTAIGIVVDTPQTAERLQAVDTIAEVPEPVAAEADALSTAQNNQATGVQTLFESPYALYPEAEAQSRAADSNTGVSPRGSINGDTVPAQVEAAATAETGASTVDSINGDTVPAEAETNPKAMITMGLVTVGLVIAAAATATAATVGILPLVFMIGAAIAACVTLIMAAEDSNEQQIQSPQLI